MLLINDRSVSILVGGAHKSLHALEALIASSFPLASLAHCASFLARITPTNYFMVVLSFMANVSNRFTNFLFFFSL